MAEITSNENLFVARPADVATLRAHFDAAVAGEGRTVVIQGPVGGGKRALVGELLRNVGDTDALIWRANLIEEEDGLRTLLRLYATLYTPLYRDPALRGRVELILNAQLPKHPKRVQEWYKAFIEALRKGGPKEGEQNFQVTLPRDNPVLGLVEIVKGIAYKMPIVMDIQTVQSAQSVGVHAAFEALLDAAPKLHLLQILSAEVVDETSRGWMPSPLIDMLERRAGAYHSVVPAPWGAEEVSAYLSSKGLQGDAANIARIVSGRPGFVAELVDILNDSGKLGDDLSTVTLYDLAPKAVDEGELDDDAEGKDGRRAAKAADVDDIAFRGALLGRAFPSNLVADIGGYDRESMDDLLDAAGGLFEELQFSKPMGTWVYQFKRASWREAALEQGKAREDYKEVAKQTALFLERFLAPRGYEFLIKTARTYAEAGEPVRAAIMRSMALSADRPELWAMTNDLLRYFKDIQWPDAMRRTVWMNLMDRMASQGDVNQAEALYNEISAWAEANNDKALKAWLRFAGSRLDFRRQDYYRSRDRAREAVTLYEELGDRVKPAEIRNHLALIELSDGKPEEARKLVDEALRTGQIDTPDGRRVLPTVAANSEYIRGLLEKRERKFKEAAEHFRLSNEIAGNTGQAPLALESGLNYGECLLASGDLSKAADILQRVHGIAQALGNQPRQRAASALVGQAHAGLRQFEAALTWAKATLSLTKALKYEQLVAIDTFNVGLFTLLGDKPTEALTLFKEARAAANLQQDLVFTKELLYNTGVAALRVGERRTAREAFTTMLPAARQSKDWGKMVGAYQSLANLSAAEGDKSNAVKLLGEALKVADNNNMKDERRAIKKRIDELSG